MFYLPLFSFLFSSFTILLFSLLLLHLLICFIHFPSTTTTTKFLLFPSLPPPPPPPHFYCFPLPPPHFYCFPLPPPSFYCFHHQQRVRKLISCVFIRNVSGFIASANIFDIILIKGQKVDFLCLSKKRVWFHCELVLIFL